MVLKKEKPRAERVPWLRLRRKCSEDYLKEDALIDRSLGNRAGKLQASSYIPLKL